MPDLTIESAEVCAEVMNYAIDIPSHSALDTVYHVTFTKAANGYTEWHCDCSGFKYRRKCQHVDQAKFSQCTWGSGAFYGSPSKPKIPGTCPTCGGPTEVVRYAT